MNSLSRPSDAVEERQAFLLVEFHLVEHVVRFEGVAAPVTTASSATSAPRSR